MAMNHIMLGSNFFKVRHFSIFALNLFSHHEDYSGWYFDGHA